MAEAAAIPSTTIAAMRAEIVRNLPHVYRDDTAEVMRSRAWGLICGAHLMLRQAAEEMRRANEIERKDVADG